MGIFSIFDYLAQPFKKRQRLIVLNSLKLSMCKENRFLEDLSLVECKFFYFFPPGKIKLRVSHVVPAVVV